MKINLRNYLIILLSVLVLSSCSTDKTMIAKGVNLNKYPAYPVEPIIPALIIFIPHFQKI